MTIFRNIVLGAIMVAAPLSTAGAYNSRDGYNRNITIYNNSDYQVYRIFYGVPGQGYYSRDLLGEHVLNANYHIRLNIDNGQGNCVYNIRAVSRNGANVWVRTVNVCRESRLTFVN